MKIAVFQNYVDDAVEKNIDDLACFLDKISHQNVDMVVMGEMFTCPYSEKNFEAYSEREGGRSCILLSGLARKHGIYLVAGSMPEYSNGQVFNTSYVYDPSGKLIAKHRKIHLFDIHVEGGQKFMESDSLTAGNTITCFDTVFGRIGLCICYDIRFPEVSRKMVEDGAVMIIVPAAFNMTTGPIHWQVLLQSRAIDFQVFTLGVAPARDGSKDYQSWGHSLLVSPWGEVLSQLDEKKGMFVEDVDFNCVQQVRKAMPLAEHRRTDLY